MTNLPNAIHFQAIHSNRRFLVFSKKYIASINKNTIVFMMVICPKVVAIYKTIRAHCIDSSYCYMMRSLSNDKNWFRYHRLLLDKNTIHR